MRNNERKTYEELLQENKILAESLALSEKKCLALEASLAASEEKNRALENNVRELQEDMMALKQDMLLLEEKYRRAMKKIFGSSSEHVAKDEDTPEQMSLLFNEPETVQETEKAETVEVKGHERSKKPKSGSLDDILTGDLPVTVVEHMPEETVCPECGSEMEVIGKEVRRTLVLIPAHAEIREDWYYKTACMVCKKEGITTPIAEAKREAILIPGGYASAEAVAEIAYEKYVMYTPLYRQEQEWNRKGVQLTRQTMSNWLLTCSKQYLRPVYEELHRQLKDAEILHADETPVQVLHEEDRRAQTKSYMWLYMTGAHEEKQIVLYSYNESRSAAVPKTYLSGYKGYLQTDGYGGYNSVEGVKRVGCLAHARRKFSDALNGMKAENRKGTAAEEGFAKIEKILLKEKELKDLTPDERQKERLKTVKPLMDDLLTWAREARVLKGSKTGEGITYLRNQWKTFDPFYEDGRIELTNNRAERSIKPFVMGRKNWLFCNAEKGAIASETYYSLIETAKFNGLDPYKYLLYVLREAPGKDLKNPETVEKLLPWNAPEECRKKTE